ncbi:MAG: hypothetical protein ACFE8O_02940 [Candidatus Hermodarchaeota archaeon]
MGVDAALPPDDWWNSAPVGHTQSSYKRVYKSRNSASIEGAGLLADNVKSALLLFLPCIW